ncbi:MAG: DUF2007 domain-containing protein [Betaproteobacteria bacterium]|nr:MAG: DUF2007 domain-containing protein [Betaproteobacteria bacterium]
MIKAYTAANLQDAHILLGLLQGQGIEARILNANAQGGLGEIPFASTYPELWLVHERDRGRARSVFEAFERPAAGTRPTRCTGCGEDNPAGFEICWNCGAPTGSG